MKRCLKVDFGPIKVHIFRAQKIVEKAVENHVKHTLESPLRSLRQYSDDDIFFI